VLIPGPNLIEPIHYQIETIQPERLVSQTPPILIWLLMLGGRWISTRTNFLSFFTIW